MNNTEEARRGARERVNRRRCIKRAYLDDVVVPDLTVAKVFDDLSPQICRQVFDGFA
jgi:hypothetical protein